MNIGIIGSGGVAQILSKGLISKGHQVMLGTRHPDKLHQWLDEVGEKGEIGSFSDAAKFGDIVIIATHGLATIHALDLAGKENLNHKTVIDVTNPLEFSAQGLPPKLVSSQGDSLGEKIQAHLPNAHVVKAFNTISAAIMVNPERNHGTPDLFICGDNEESKKSTEALAKELGWKSVIDMGGIKKSYLLEALAMIWIDYGFSTGHWTHAFKLMKD